MGKVKARATRGALLLHAIQHPLPTTPRFPPNPTSLQQQRELEGAAPSGAGERTSDRTVLPPLGGGDSGGGAAGAGAGAGAGGERAAGMAGTGMEAGVGAAGTEARIEASLLPDLDDAIKRNRELVGVRGRFIPFATRQLNPILAELYSFFAPTSSCARGRFLFFAGMRGA